MAMTKKLRYQRTVLEDISRELGRGDRDEMAIPSYLHKNPLIVWLVSIRMGCVISALQLGEDDNLLDFGCGTAMLFLQLPPGPGRYYGTDLILGPAKEVLEKHNRSDVRLIFAQGWQKEIADDSLDRIVALEVLEHVEDVSAVAQDFRKKLKPDGRLVISGPTENRFYQLCRKIAGFSGHYHHRNIFNIKRQIESAGFTEIKRTTLPLPGPLGLFVVLTYSISGATN